MIFRKHFRYLKKNFKIKKFQNISDLQILVFRTINKSFIFVDVFYFCRCSLFFFLLIAFIVYVKSLNMAKVFMQILLFIYFLIYLCLLIVRPIRQKMNFLTAYQNVNRIKIGIGIVIQLLEIKISVVICLITLLIITFLMLV